MITGYERANYIERVCRELHAQIGVAPVVGYVLLDSQWRHVLCHPDDYEKTDEETFTHPFVDIP